MKPKVVLLGTRGSVPVSGEEFLRYGGSTTCIFLRLAGQPIVLDAGTGMLGLSEVLEKEEQHITLLLSHPHVDHLLGLPICRTVFDPKKKIDIYGATRNGKNVKEQVLSFLQPPLWPVGPEQLPANISFFDLPQRLFVGDVEIETMEGVHPGGVTLFRITGGGKRVVLITDCTLTEELFSELTEFARNCDLLLCDGQYSLSEWSGRENFGHSTWIDVAKLGVACGASKVRIIHHDPGRTDAELDHATMELTAIHKNCAFARAGEEVLL